MKKWCSLILSLLLLLSVTGCNFGGRSNPDELVVIWDSTAFLYNFDNIHTAIQTSQKELDSNLGNPTEVQKNLTRKQIASTQLMADWASERGKTIKCVDWGWADTLTQKLSAAFLAKQGPDIICGEGQLPSFMAQGVLEPFPSELETYIKQNMSPIAYNAMTDENGRIYGVTMCPSNTILAWNKNILREAGVATEIVENGPKTWAEWEAAMQKVADMGNPLKLPGGVYYAPNSGGYLRVGALLNGNGGGFAGSDGKPNVNIAANEAPLELVRTTAKLNGYNTALKGTDTGYFSAFKGGNLAYIVDGVWAIQQNSGLEFEVGFSLVPGPTADKSSNQLLGAGYMSVPTYSKNKELAFACLLRMLQEDIQQNLADGGLRTPALTSVYTSEQYQQEHPQLYEFAQFARTQNISGLPAFANAGDRAGLWDAFGACLFSLTKSDEKSPVFSTNVAANTLLKKAQNEMMAAYNS